MNRYLLSIIQPDGLPPPSVDLQKIMREVNALTAEMKSAGALVFTDGLHPADQAKVVRSQGELVTDGPYVEAKEHLGGLCIVQAPDRAAALSWAKKLARATTLPVELREFQRHGE